jgi:4-amino-4-deoxy-L-arabinose transferase-like glycosyltransferase
MRLGIFFLLIIFFLASFLRFYKIDQVPHGLYIDEVSIGYNAYTILTKGVDEHGVSYPLFFEAFGEYKMPIPIYLTSISIAVFGKNDFAVRFPSALFGVLTVLLFYLTVRRLFRKESVAFLSALFLAITPWHIQLSRANFEANIALFFYLLGGFLFLEFLHTKNKWLIVGSFVSFLLTVYIYNTYRLVAPLTLIACSFIIYKSFPKIRKFLSTAIILLFVLFLPMLLFSLTPDGTQRFSSTSAFAQLSHLSPLQQIITSPAVVIENYLSSLTGRYLFATGDGNGRHSVIGIGNVFRWELLFFLAGCFFLFKKRKEFSSKVVFFILFLAPLTSAFTSPNPHGLRSLLIVLPLTVLVAYGLVVLWEKKFMFKYLFFAGVFLFVVYEFLFYLHVYYVHYPIRTAPDWGGAYKEMMFEITQEQHNYSRVVVNDNIGTMVNNYRNFYNDKLVYELVNDDWEKPISAENEKILYITSSNEKRNRLLKKIPHTLIKDIELSSYHKGIFAQFWEI